MTRHTAVLGILAGALVFVLRLALAYGILIGGAWLVAAIMRLAP